jgi:uncharacterized protein YbjT (DUF2867 family)
MRVFIAGASGAVGRRLVLLALGTGHQVTGMTRFDDKADGLRANGAEAVVANALDRAAVVAAVAKVRSEVVVHQLTALSSFTNLRRFDREFEATNFLRTQGTTNLIAAARAAGARPAKFQGALDAIRYLERAVLAAEGLDGVVLRYGAFYGPGTSLGEGGRYVEAVRRRRFRSSATAPACGRSSISTTWLRPRFWRSSAALPAFITSSTMSLPRSPNGCPFLPPRLPPRRRGISRPGRGGCWSESTG